jgi:hypothetical protein
MLIGKAGVCFMLSSQGMVALPFWILGLPLAVAIISYVRPAQQGGFIPPDRRNQRSNFISDPIIRAGDSVLFKG